MIKLQKTRIIKSLHRNVATGYNLENEGMALVYVNEGGEARVRPSSGAAGERFAGCSLSQVTVPSQLTAIEEIVGAGATTINTTRPMLVAGQVAVVVDGAYLAVVAAGAEAAGKFSVDTDKGIITLAAADAGTAQAPVDIKLIYKYNPTVAEAINAQGQAQAGGVIAAQYYGVTGIITEGDVSTDQFDVTDDWANASGPIFLGANGLFTLKEGGTELKGANLIEAPQAVAGSMFGAFLTIFFGTYSA